MLAALSPSPGPAEDPSKGPFCCPAQACCLDVASIFCRTRKPGHGPSAPSLWLNQLCGGLRAWVGSQRC